MIDKQVQHYIDQSVLCWLATADANNQPNVSPKELFLAVNDCTLVIANIASPQSVHNIKENEQVCVSMVDVFVQKGVQLKGKAQIVAPPNPLYQVYKAVFEARFGAAFPMASFIVITITQVKEILAPSYQMHPNTSEKAQIASALETYRVKALQQQIKEELQ